MLGILTCFIFYSCEYRQGYLDGQVSNFKDSRIYDLAKYVKEGNVPKIEMMLKLNDYDINELSPIGNSSLLSLAVFENESKTVTCLMKHGADPFLKTRHYSSPMLDAIQYCKIECLREMIKYGRFDTIPEGIAVSALNLAYGECDEAFTLLKKMEVQKKDPGLNVYYSFILPEFKPGDKNGRHPIDLMKVGFTFDDSLPIRRPDLILNKNHKGKTISQIIKDENILLTEDEVEYLKREKGIDVVSRKK